MKIIQVRKISLSTDNLFTVLHTLTLQACCRSLSILGYLGCYKDSLLRDMTGGFLASAAMTVRLCFNFCTSNVSSLFSVIRFTLGLCNKRTRHEIYKMFIAKVSTYRPTVFKLKFAFCFCFGQVYKKVHISNLILISCMKKYFFFI